MAAREPSFWNPGKLEPVGTSLYEQLNVSRATLVALDFCSIWPRPSLHAFLSASVTPHSPGFCLCLYS